MKKRYMKILALILVCAMMFSLCSCGKKEEKKTTEATTEEITTEATTEEVTTEAVPQVDDEGFTIVKQKIKTIDYVNVRMSPSTDGDIYQQLANDVTLQRIGYNDEWSKITIDGNTYYVFSEYVEVIEDEKEDSEKEDNEDAEDTEEDDSDGSDGSGKLIIIDPGHQSTDNSDEEPIGPGATETKPKASVGNVGVSTGISEFELNLEIAVSLKAELESRGYTVKLCRDKNDVDLSNAARAEYANNKAADAFIRIHTNGSTDSSASGCMTVCQTKDNPYNADIYEKCRALSEYVLSELSSSTGAKAEGVWETDTMSGINWSQVPVTIVEVGYMTNPDEEALLVTYDYQSKIAKGIANGIDKFLAK